jgi:indolepyruvate ferredoxin oxidoreductase beta subunit
VGQHVRTTTVLGFLRVWLLARLRVLRPRSLRAQRELALIDRWQRAVLECAALDEALALEVVELARVVRGYGEVRRRLAGGFRRVLDERLAPAVTRDRAAGAGYARARAEVAEARRLMLADEKGVEQAFDPAAP